MEFRGYLITKESNTHEEKPLIPNPDDGVSFGSTGTYHAYIRSAKPQNLKHTEDNLEEMLRWCHENRLDDAYPYKYKVGDDVLVRRSSKEITGELEEVGRIESIDPTWVPGRPYKIRYRRSPSGFDFFSESITTTNQWYIVSLAEDTE